MTLFFQRFALHFFDILSLLNSYYFTIYGYRVSLLGIFVAFAVFGIILSIFWKGGKY